MNFSARIPVTLVLPFDKETEDSILKHVSGAMRLCRDVCDLAALDSGEPTGELPDSLVFPKHAKRAAQKLRVIVTFSAARPDAPALMDKIRTTISQAAPFFFVSSVPERDMALYQGVWGLITTQLWAMMGHVLLIRGPLEDGTLGIALFEVCAAMSVQGIAENEHLSDPSLNPFFAYFISQEHMCERGLRSRADQARDMSHLIDIFSGKCRSGASDSKSSLAAPKRPWWQFWK